MFKQPINSGRNLERFEIFELGGLNTAASSRDNEFSELVNLTNEEYPYLKTIEGRKFKIGNGTSVLGSEKWKPWKLLAKDSERGFENEYVTAFKTEQRSDSNVAIVNKLAYGPHHKGAMFLWNGSSVPAQENAEQLLLIGDRTYVVLPDVVQIKCGENKGYGSPPPTWSTTKTELAKTTERYHQMASPDGHTAVLFSSTELYINYNEALKNIKDAYDNGTLRVGDYISFSITAKNSGDIPSGFSASNTYAITAIATGKASSDKYDQYIKLTLSALDSSGASVSHNSIEITTTNLMSQDITMKIYKVNPFVLGEYFGRRLFACDTSGTSIWASVFGDPLNFSVDATDAGAAIISCGENSRWTAIKAYNENVYAFKLDSVYRIDGTASLSYSLTKVSELGALNQKSVCVSSDTLYFMNKSGIYAFGGGSVQLISGDITDCIRNAVSAVLGGSLHRLYAAVNYSDGKQRLFVLNLKNGLWHEETVLTSSAKITDMCDYAGKLMAATSAGVYVLNSPEGEATEKNFPFRFVTKKYFYLFDKKAVGEVNIKMSAEKPVTVSISYDGGEFTGTKTMTLRAGIGRVPIKLKKCTTFQIKVEGTGKAEIHALEFSLYKGGRWYGAQG